MPDLLTDQDRRDFDAAVQDLKDTFFRIPAAIRKRTQRRLEAFNEDIDRTLASCDIEFTGLYVPDKTDDDAEADRRHKGTLDNSEGFIYIGYDEALATTPPLINDNGDADIIPGQDTLLLLGNEYTIIGVNLVGPRLDIFHLVKIHWSKRIRPNGSV